jgi:hypothetical protein
LALIELQQNAQQLHDVLVTAKQENVSNKMEKKTYSIAANISQSGGSVYKLLKIYLALLLVKMVKLN